MGNGGTRILIQLDSDAQASVFDGVVAIDAGVEHLFRHGRVTAEQVRDLVYGAMFTRGPAELHNTAIFVGGADVAAGQALLERVTECFFGPMRVSIMLDANGANTTAAAAVISAARHIELRDTTILVLAATGPVGQRAAQLLAMQGAHVRLGSRRLARAESACSVIAEKTERASVSAHQTATAQETNQARELAHRTMEAMGGAEGLDTIRYLRFDFQVEVDGNKVYVGKHLWDRKSGRYREEWELFGEQAQALFNVQTKDGRVYRGGDEIEAAESAEVLEQAYYNHLNDSYWLLMPWKLTDPGVHLSNLGRETVNGKTYDVLHLSFDDEIVEITHGIEAGERVVVRGLETLTDGTRVRVTGS